MKITVVNKHREDSLGGSELQCDFISTELTKRGHDVNYIAINGMKESYDTDYEVIPCRNDGPELLNKILSSKPDVVYWRYHKNYINEVFKPLHHENVKIVFAVSSEYDVHYFLYNRKQSLRSNIKRLLRNAKQFKGFKYVDAVVVNNESHLDELPVKLQKFIPNGMSLDFEPFEWERPYCIWIANIKRIKRPELYIELAKQVESVDFLMVGAVQEGEYKWIEEKKELPENLHYLGAKTFAEVNGIIRESLFHIHTCMAEGFPNVFIQAWLFGKASVSYGFDPSGYIENNKLGYCSDENWAQFIDDVNRLCEDSDKRNELGQNARSFAEEMFKIENSVTMLEDLIKNL